MVPVRERGRIRVNGMWFLPHNFRNSSLLFVTCKNSPSARSISVANLVCQVVDVSRKHISSFNKFCTNLQHLLIMWSVFWGCGALVPVLHLYCYFLLLYALLFCCCAFHCLYLCYFSVIFVFLGWPNNWHFCYLARTLINTYWIIIVVIIIIIIIIIITGIFFLVLLLSNQWWSPPHRLQVSDCSTFVICVMFQV